MMTRRRFLAASAVSTCLGGAALALPHRHIVEHTVSLRKSGVWMRVALLTDPHVIEPWFSLNDWSDVLRETQKLNPDLILLGGDYSGYNIQNSTLVSAPEIAAAASKIGAPLGTYAAIGNHDWSCNELLGGTWGGELAFERAFDEQGIKVLRNQAIKLNHNGRPFWLAMPDSDSYDPRAMPEMRRPADIQKTLSSTFSDSAPLILLAHEPDVFAQHHPRVDLQLSGHMHAGQVNMLGWTPASLPSRYGDRYLHGHIKERGKDLIVSGGLGYSRLPVRVGAPPEITMVSVEI